MLPCDGLIYLFIWLIILIYIVPHNRDGHGPITGIANAILISSTFSCGLVLLQHPFPA